MSKDLARCLPVLFLVAVMLSIGVQDAHAAPRIWFVRNTALSGDGSQSSPFARLMQAQIESAAGDVIFVFAGDGTTRAYDLGLALKDGQSVIGEGAGLVVDGVTVVPPGRAPLLTSVVGPAISLASGNVIRGLTIADAAGAGIAANGLIAGLEVSQVSILRSRGDGINIDEASGLIRIDHATFDTAAGELARIGTASDLTLEVVATTFANALPPLGDEGLQLTVRGNGRVRISVTDSTFRNLIGEALDITAGRSSGSAGTIEVQLVRNLFTGRFEGDGKRGANGVAITAEEGDSVAVTIDENHFSTVGGAGAIILRVEDHARMNARVVRNTVAGTDANAIDIAFDEESRLDAVIESNLLTNVARNGILAVAFPGNSQSVLAIRQNRIERTTGEGIALSLYAGTMRAVVSGNDTSGTTRTGFALSNLGSGTFFLVGNPLMSAHDALRAGNTGTAGTTGPITVVNLRPRAVGR